MSEAPEGVRHPSNSEFLRHLASAAPKGSTLWTTAFPGDPGMASGAAWQGNPFNIAMHAALADSWGPLNSYFCGAALGPGPDGEVARRKESFRRLLAVVADDPNPEELRGPVSWLVRTSPGKWQAGIFLDERDPACADLERCERLFAAMRRAGFLGDVSGNNPVRLVRLPVGTNHKPRESGPFAHQLEHWNPGVQLTLADAAAVFGIDLSSEPAPSTATGGTPPDRRASSGGGSALADWTNLIVRGEQLHDATAQMAASLIASGIAPGAAVNLLRGLMNASAAPRDERWLARMADIPRAVSTAVEKFSRPAVAAEGPPAPAWSVVPVDDLDTAELEPQGWFWDHYIPARELTLLGAHGGTGKSMFALMLAVCVALGIPFLGVPTRRAPVVFFSAEDDAPILRRRLSAILRSLGVASSGLGDWLRVIDATTVPAELAEMVSSLGSDGVVSPARMQLTSIGADLRDLISGIGSAPLLIVDNASDTYGGNEIVRPEVRGFIRALLKMVRPLGGAVVLLAHLDKASAKGGGGESYSGSTAWHNSARSRLTMARDKTDDSVSLTHEKSNHGPRRDPMRLVSGPDGVLTSQQGQGDPGAGLLASSSTKALLRLIEAFTARGEFVSTATTSPTHAGKLLRQSPDFPARLPNPQVFELLRAAEDRGWVRRVQYAGPNRHPRERWQVTTAGCAMAGLAPTAPTAPTSALNAPSAGGAASAPTAPTSARGGVGGCERAEVGAEAEQ